MPSGLWVPVGGAGRRSALAAMFFVGTPKAFAAKAPPTMNVITNKSMTYRLFDERSPVVQTPRCRAANWGQLRLSACGYLWEGL
ncbi:hypothetical protein D3C85_1464820 [compost metagenome]